MKHIISFILLALLTIGCARQLPAVEESRPIPPAPLPAPATCKEVLPTNTPIAAEYEEALGVIIEKVCHGDQEEEGCEERVIAVAVRAIRKHYYLASLPEITIEMEKNYPGTVKELEALFIESHNKAALKACDAKK